MRSASHRGIRVVLLIALAILIVALIGVIWVLPDHVDQVTLSPDETPAVQPAPPPPTEEETQTAMKKREAERALSEFLGKQAVLEAQEVAIWGQDAYQQVLSTLAGADASFANGDFESARSGYVEGTALLEELDASRPKRLEQALQSGAQALLDFDGVEAARQFEIATALDPQNREALAGADRAVNIARVRELLDQAWQREQDADLQAAKDLYQQAAALDREVDEALQGLARANAAIEAARFRELMSTALSAIRSGRFDDAQQALAEAENLRSDSSDVKDAKEQLRLAIQAQQIGILRRHAGDLAQAERWHEAAREYGAVLAIEPQAQFAVQGLAHSRKMAELHDQLDQYLGRPDRLHYSEPRANARTLLDTVALMSDKGGLLNSKQQQLAAVLEQAETPVEITLRSDNLTSVRIDRVGDLGQFEETVVDLLPGRYVVRGARIGYRDVRLELDVRPGQAGPPLLIQCEERI